MLRLSVLAGRYPTIFPTATWSGCCFHARPQGSYPPPVHRELRRKGVISFRRLMARPRLAPVRGLPPRSFCRRGAFVQKVSSRWFILAARAFNSDAVLACGAALVVIFTRIVSPPDIGGASAVWTTAMLLCTWRTRWAPAAGVRDAGQAARSSPCRWNPTSTLNGSSAGPGSITTSRTPLLLCAVSASEADVGAAYLYAISPYQHIWRCANRLLCHLAVCGLPRFCFCRLAR